MTAEDLSVTDPEGLYSMVNSDPSLYRPITPDEAFHTYGITVPGYTPQPTDANGNVTGPALWEGVAIPGTEPAATVDEQLSAHVQHFDHEVSRLAALHAAHKARVKK